MILQTVTIDGFRSVEHTSLEQCGRFNVIIGKNNSGKSNILAAILGFFDTIKPGHIITLRPRFTDADDFFNRNNKRPIEIACVFALDPSDLDIMLKEIELEFPQISNAVSNLQGCSFAKITTKHFVGANTFSIVSMVALGTSSQSTTESFTTVFEISDSVSPQIFSIYSLAGGKMDDVASLNRLYRAFDSDDFSRAKSDKSGQSTRSIIERYITVRRRGLVEEEFYFMSSLGSTPSHLLPIIESDLGDSDSFVEFQSALRQRTMQFEQEAVALRKTSISGSIYTLGGQQHMVPDYVSSLCARLSKLKVLYQSERRDPIGPADAQRLLSLRVKKGGDRLFRTFQTSVAALIGVEVDAFEEDDVSSQTRRSTGR